MKVRLRPISRGSVTTMNWRRLYVVEVKTFLLWNNVGTFEAYKDAADCMDKFGNPYSVIYEY